MNFVKQLVFQVHDSLLLICYLSKTLFFLRLTWPRQTNEWINKHNFWGVNNPYKGKTNCRACSSTCPQGCRGAWGERCDRGCFPPAQCPIVWRALSILHKGSWWEVAGFWRTASLQGKCWLKQVCFLYVLLHFAILKTSSKMLLINTWKYLKGSASFYFSAKS